MSKLFDKAIIYNMAGITRNTAQDVASALAEDLTPSEVNTFNPDAVSTALNLLGMPLSNGEVAVNVAIALNKVLATKPAADPGEGLWRSFGFTQPIPVDEEIYGADPAMAVGIAGTGAVLLCVEIRERVLPSASINDALIERVASFEEKEGRSAGKKDIAMLKDEITARMLKTAPIRRKRVPVLLAHGLCVMFTTSYKLSDDIGALLRKLFGTWPVTPVFTDSLQPWMHGLIYDKKLPLDEMNDDQLAEQRFYPGENAKLRDKDDDAVITIKDETLTQEGSTAQLLVDRAIGVEEMSLTFYPRGALGDMANDRINLKVHKSGILKKFELAGLTAADLDGVMDRMTGLDGPQDNELSLRPMASLYIITHALKTLLDEMIKVEALLPEYAGYGFVGEGEQLADLEDLIKQELDEDEEWEDDEL
ncbi:MAG: recombination-associated protein RdgC [Aeromonas veronii]